MQFNVNAQDGFCHTLNFVQLFVLDLLMILDDDVYPPAALPSKLKFCRKSFLRPSVDTTPDTLRFALTKFPTSCTPKKQNISDLIQRDDIMYL